MSLLSQGQIDDASPFATPLWMDVPSAEAPAYAGMTLCVGMTLVVQSTHRGRGEYLGTCIPRSVALRAPFRAPVIVLLGCAKWALVCDRFVRLVHRCAEVRVCDVGADDQVDGSSEKGF